MAATNHNTGWNETESGGYLTSRRNRRPKVGSGRPLSAVPASLLVNATVESADSIIGRLSIVKVELRQIIDTRGYNTAEENAAPATETRRHVPYFISIKCPILGDNKHLLVELATATLGKDLDIRYRVVEIISAKVV